MSENGANSFPKAKERLLEIKPEDLTVFLISVILFLSAFIVDYSNLPGGWELPKVHFLQIALLIVITFSLVASRKFGSKKSMLILFLPILLILVSTINSGYERTFGNTIIKSPLYSFIELFINIPNKNAVLGNVFRDMGFITITILLTSIYVLYNSINKNNYKIVLITIFIIGVIQSFIGIKQAVYISNHAQYSLSEGRWIYGTFGQSNFYSGILLSSICTGFFFLKSKRKWVLISVLLLLIPMTAGLILSMSTWAIITLMIFVVLFFILDILMQPKLSIAIGTIVLLLSFLLFLPQIQDLLPDEIYKNHFFRFDIWNNVIGLYTSNTKDLLLGTGLDTLGEHFISNNLFEGKYVDRTHNLFLQILISSGIFPLILYIGGIIILGIKSIKSNNRNIEFLMLIVIVLNLRGVLHTSSILNLLILGVVTSLAYKLQTREI